MPDTDLLLVRHGEAHCDTAGIAGGDLGCTGLTRRGRSQAERAARRLTVMHTTERRVDAVYADPRRRVRETAEIIAGRLRMPVILESRLTEPCHGSADGQPWADIWTTFGGTPADRPDDPVAPGAESWNHFVDRAAAGLRHMVERHRGQRALLITHAATVEVAHATMLGLPNGPDPRAAFVLAHASITWWSHRASETGPPRWHLVWHNSTAHLALGLPDREVEPAIRARRDVRRPPGRP
ncbi:MULTISPECIES: histidine phosphatase family protein [unclassified Parafrankia]|uniref:histidine phosphatase family protein n=1 Tax=unclassified Parafrankia TaxID=2994368 RepID=UPI000DA4692D|nr:MULTISPECIES: histidine phosphatase family protein [unclassified Parafrankia]TCJ31799.1 histidine phosphatase family protein [Parafrankia sp. BMG5.11]CAI7975826.1 Phosphoglycerate mutase [Frankia sp. Hr75.2]SQD95157.1 Phosphoglycerate mutase [Parafrankia sp. Ea1.12]